MKTLFTVQFDNIKGIVKADDSNKLFVSYKDVKTKQDADYDGNEKAFNTIIAKISTGFIKNYSPRFKDGVQLDGRKYILWSY